MVSFKILLFIARKILERVLSNSLWIAIDLYVLEYLSMNGYSVIVIADIAICLINDLKIKKAKKNASR